MRITKLLWAGTATIIAGALTTLSLTQGQDQSPPMPPAGGKAPVEPARAGRDLSKWTFFQKQVYFSGQRGSEWLRRANRPDGKFVHGYLPALRAPMEGDSYLNQAAGALALSRAAKYYGDDQAGALARQAVLTLLLETSTEEGKSPTIRLCSLPGGVVNPLAAAATLVQAIHELPTPAADLLTQSEELCNYLRRAQRADGSFACGESGPQDQETINLYSGEAVYALIRGQQHKPAPWKLEAVRKAMGYYQARWRVAKNLPMVPRYTAAYAEAYQLTKDKAYADCVFEMNDWLCTFQYVQLDPQHPLWVGGFMGCVDGKPSPSVPHAGTAVFAESLAEAARVARMVGDVQRWNRYKDTLERSLQFLTTLQYTEANTQHFADWYRPVVLGAFHGSHTDGNLRLDWTQQAVCATLAYLNYVADVP